MVSILTAFNPQPQTLQITGKIVDGVRFFASAAKSKAVLGGLKFAAGLSVPADFLTIGSSAKTIISSTACISEKVDAVLLAGNAVQGLGQTTEKLAAGLNVVGAVSTEAIRWVTPLSFVGMGLDVFSLIFNTKSVIDTSRGQEGFVAAAAVNKATEDYTLEDYRKGLRFLEGAREKNHSFLNKMLGVDEDKVADHLVRIEMKAVEKLKSADKSKQKEATEALHATVCAVKQRMQQKKKQHRMGLIAAIIGILAGILLLTPAFPVGFALAGIAAAIAVARFFIDRHQKKKFLKELQRLC